MQTSSVFDVGDFDNVQETNKNVNTYLLRLVE